MLSLEWGDSLVCICEVAVKRGPSSLPISAVNRVKGLNTMMGWVGVGCFRSLGGHKGIHQLDLFPTNSYFIGSPILSQLSHLEPHRVEWSHHNLWVRILVAEAPGTLAQGLRKYSPFLTLARHMASQGQKPPSSLGLLISSNGVLLTRWPYNAHMKNLIARLVSFFFFPAYCTCIPMFYSAPLHIFPHIFF